MHRFEKSIICRERVRVSQVSFTDCHKATPLAFYTHCEKELNSFLLTRNSGTVIKGQGLEIASL